MVVEQPEFQRIPVLLTGASGYAGGRLIPMLEATLTQLRCMARNPENLKTRVKKSTKLVASDVLEAVS